jgi:phosphoribosylformylglycinamidine cyclo-ligase
VERDSKHTKLDSYRMAGVDAEHGDELASWLAHSNNQKFIHPQGLGALASGIGGFAGIFDINFKQFEKPQLVASTDGVGTKLLLGLKSGKINGLGQDLVAMCVNDLYTVGAYPLFFLDYYATGALSSDQFKEVLGAIQESCTSCGMALMGGETAEMPGLYQKGHFDLAGFVVGVVDHKDKLGSHRTQEGDILISFASTGFHSNGYSLIRKWLDDFPHLGSPQNIERLMTPTKLYSQVLTLAKLFPKDLHALANITGGGISGNLPRVIGANQECVLRQEDLPTPQWMRDFVNGAGVGFNDIEPVFNMGVGMIAVVASTAAGEFVSRAKGLELMPKIIGEVKSTHLLEPQVRYI